MRTWLRPILCSALAGERGEARREARGRLCRFLESAREVEAGLTALLELTLVPGGWRLTAGGRFRNRWAWT